ncbi:MAG: arylsulfatase [Isosphaeraceae bacterium]|nr:arylsulfatase [Isosphaeraceae bacterium]
MNRWILAISFAAMASLQATAVERPNIVFIIADDLGFGDLSCQGQKRFRTPNIDRIAKEGMRFTTHYSGSPVCAPSRCVLMTGKHAGHATIRENRQWKPPGEGQWPVGPGELSLPLALKKLGYATGGFGKWGLGAPGSTGEPLRQGFDRFFGYNCQAVAHNFYPTHLWDDDKRIELGNPAFSAQQILPTDADPLDPRSYDRYRGKVYAPDRINAEARAFVRANASRPFFLYVPTTVPHLALQVPEDSLAEFRGKFGDEPYRGDRRYLPVHEPRATYAAMIKRLDDEVGRLLDLLDELKIADRTIVVFTSDNGPLYDRLGGTDADFFESAGVFSGRKGSAYEGGIRVPCLVRYPGKVAAGSTSDRVTGFEDWLPTLLELIGAGSEIPSGIDGISFGPTLLGEKQPERPFLYRETPGYGGYQAVRVGKWKALRKGLNPGPKQKLAPGATELFDLENDPAESRDRAGEEPEVVARLERLMREQHVPSTLFPMRALDSER